MPIVTLNPLGDTYINSTTPAANHGADTTIIIGNLAPIAPATAYRMWRGLIRFDLSTIPDFTPIPSHAFAFTAILRVYNAGTDPVGSGTIPISAYQVLQNWNDLQATWTNRLAATPWSAPGCDNADVDYNSVPQAIQLIQEAAAGWYNWNITNLVRDWLWGNSSDFGVILANYSPATFNGTTKEFYSNEHGVPALRPQLVINYELASDIPIITPEPAYTKGTSNTISWSDESASGAIEYYPQAALNNNFTTGIRALASIDREECIAPSSVSSLSTYFSIGYIEGVFTNRLKTGTNYYAGGSFLGPLITLGTNLPSISSISFSGTGLNNLTTSGTYTDGSNQRIYIVRIASIGIPDTFDWSDNGGGTWTTGVAITGAAQLLSYGISITFATTTGHTVGNSWTFIGKIFSAYVFYKTNGWIPLRLFGTFSELLDGYRYYYRVKSRNVLLAESNWSPRVFSTQDDSINALRLLSPNGTEVWDGGFTKIVQWIADDTTSGLTTNATLYNSIDSGENWNTLATSPNQNVIWGEAQVSTTDRRVYTDYYIKSIAGVYLSTDVLGVGTPTFTGTGLNDMTTGGSYTSIETLIYRVQIDSTGATDTFAWSDTNGVTWNATGVAITGAAQILNNGVTITFGAVAGHTLVDRWIFTGGHLGTNFYTGGEFSLREISLTTPLPSSETSVVIDYTTYGKYSWSIPTNIDSSESRVKVRVTDNVGNTLEDFSDKDFTDITIKNRLHNSVYDISSGDNIDNLMRTYAYNEQLISHASDDVKRGYFIKYAEDTDLDLHGAGYGVLRDSEESDKNYRIRVINNLTSLKNTKQAILDAVAPYVNNAWIYEWMGNWEDDYCFFLDWSFLDYRDYLTGGMYPGIDGAPYTFELHVNPKPINRVERLTSSAVNIVYTDYPILYLDGVYDNASLTGTNYYLPVPNGNFTVGPPTFVGAGLNDMTTRGYYLGSGAKNYRVEIDSTGAVDTFRWSDNNGLTWLESGVAITGAAQQLRFVGPTSTVDDNVYVMFGAVNGHTLTNYWNFQLKSNIISLGTNLLNANTTVYVKYTPQTILRKIAEAVDLVKPAGVVPYIILELGSYYGENYYAEFLFGL